MAIHVDTINIDFAGFPMIRDKILRREMAFSYLPALRKPQFSVALVVLESRTEPFETALLESGNLWAGELTRVI